MKKIMALFLAFTFVFMTTGTVNAYASDGESPHRQVIFKKEESSQNLFSCDAKRSEYVKKGTDISAIIAEKRSEFEAQITADEDTYTADYSSLFTDSTYAVINRTEKYDLCTNPVYFQGGGEEGEEPIILISQIIIHTTVYHYDLVSVITSGKQEKGAAPKEEQLKNAPKDYGKRLNASSVKLTADIKKGRIALTWDEVEGVSNYQIRYRKAGDKEWTQRYTKGRTRFVIRNLEKGSCYDIRLRAVEKTADGWAVSPWTKTYRRYFKKTKVSSLTFKGKRLTVKWAKDKKVWYYILRVGKERIWANGKATSKSTRVKKGDSFSIRLRAVVRVNDKKYYSFR